MIDLHSHLLPGIDDGAADMNQALEMAAHAVACGTTHMVCTPHLHPGRYNNTKASIALVVAQFAQALAKAGIALQVSAAAEARFDSDLVNLAMEGQLPYLGEWNGRKVLLLEFPHSEIPRHAEKLTAWMLKNNIQPLIAHPERNKGLMGPGNHKRIEPFLAQGCLLQVTAGAVAGHFGSSAQELAERFLLAGQVTILASDAHNMKNRPPNLLPGLEHAAELIGESAARLLVDDNPWRIARSHFAAASAA
ncbi:tyrosine-protein phosphatase [Pseudomonas turukhanskensis]|uniref:protein-tyrosine-phosphatase n=1 Tax=Pseudomonas turukhanskensis TaxID=1806536 RepID=A0A9W6K4I9_9PSED|nr:CpsB/CapC family capsule biosynthesis tyrosine phosphatase [Pseudomonas turukhanskensis]GLK88113.1 exopolysaccharide biosynthesis protein [Pseudomonas turukhanskensis]